MKPAISVVMPVYNGEKFLAEAIESILNQTMLDFELIIVNDKSTDSSVSIAKKYANQDKRIRIIDNKYEKGLSGALNTGLDATEGLYIARADADDILRPHRLKTQFDFLESNKNIDIVGGGYRTFGNATEKEIFHPSSSLEIARKFLTNTYFCHPTVMFRKSLLTTIPHYPQVICEDFAFFSIVVRSHKGYNIKNILVDYREHTDNYSLSHKEKITNSVFTTFKDNYNWYLGTLFGAEQYYEFKAKRILHLKDLFRIIHTELYILKKIRQTYKLPIISLQNMFSLFNFKKEVIIALLLTAVNYKK